MEDQKRDHGSGWRRTVALIAGTALPRIVEAPGKPSRLPENGKESRTRKARRIVLAIIDLVHNVQGEFSAHVFAVAKLSGKNTTCTIQCVDHDCYSFGIIN